MSIEKLRNINDWDKIYVEMVRRKWWWDDDDWVVFNIVGADYAKYVDDRYTFYTEEQIKEKYIPKVPEDGMVEIWNDCDEEWELRNLDRFYVCAIIKSVDDEDMAFSKWRFPQKETTIEQLEARIQELEKLLANK